jgi:glycosyltransferase involved in cell wall biosynthesis
VNRPIKVLHAIGSLSKGGAELQCRLLANHIDAEKYDVSILCFDGGPNPDILSHVRPIYVDRGSRWDVFGLICRIDEIIAAEQPDLVQAWLPEIISVPAAWASVRRGIPVISGHRNTLTFEGNWSLAIRDLFRLPQYFMAKRIVSNFDVSEEPRLFRRLYNKKCGECILNGIAFDQLRSMQQRQLRARAKHRLIFAGRLAPQKGIPVALRALNLLIDQGLDVHLTLFGEGPDFYEAELRNLVGELSLSEHVTFYGECRDWQAYAEDATALIFPTKGEGTSNTVLEALSVGLPVVISDIAMARALFKNRIHAVVVNSEEASVWADEIAQLLECSALSSTLSSNGRELSEQFSVASMVQSYERIYGSLMSDRDA